MLVYCACFWDIPYCWLGCISWLRSTATPSHVVLWKDFLHAFVSFPTWAFSQVRKCIWRRLVTLWSELLACGDSGAPEDMSEAWSHDCGHRDFYDPWSIPQKSAWSPWCFGISLSVFEFIAADSMVGLCPTDDEDVGINTLQCMVCTLSLCDSSIDLLRISVLAVIEPRSHTSDVCMARGGFKI